MSKLWTNRHTNLPRIWWCYANLLFLSVPIRLNNSICHLDHSHFFGLSLCYKNPLCFPCFASSRKQGDPDYETHWSGRLMEFLSCWHACDKVNMCKHVETVSISTFYPYKVHIHRIIYANTRKRDLEKHAKTIQFHHPIRASESAAPPGTWRSTNYQLRMA